MIETKDFKEDSLYLKVKEVERNYDYLRNDIQIGILIRF